MVDDIKSLSAFLFISIILILIFLYFFPLLYSMLLSFYIPDVSILNRKLMCMFCFPRRMRIAYSLYYLIPIWFSCANWYLGNIVALTMWIIKLLSLLILFFLLLLSIRNRLRKLPKKLMNVYRRRKPSESKTLMRQVRPYKVISFMVSVCHLPCIKRPN